MTMIIPNDDGYPVMTLERASISSKRPGIDITVKSAKDGARLMAPTWEMVRAIKGGLMHEQDYTAKYFQILGRNETAIIHYLRSRCFENRGLICFLCYCPDTAFCHTHLLIEWLTERHPNSFVDGNREYLRLLSQADKAILQDVENGHATMNRTIEAVKTEISAIEQAIAKKRSGYGYGFRG